MKKAMIAFVVLSVVIFLADIFFISAGLVNIGGYHIEWYETWTALIAFILINLSFLAALIGFTVFVTLKTYNESTVEEKEIIDGFLVKVFKRTLRQAKKRRDGWGKFARIIG